MSLIKKVPMSQIRQKYKSIKINKKVLAVILCLWIASFMIDIWPILFLSLFCIANSILLTIDRYVSAPIDLELSTFSAVIFTMVYGLPWGIAVAILSKVAAIIYNKNIRVDHVFMIIGYIIAALVTNVLMSFGLKSILAIGVTATIIVNIYTVIISKFVTMLSDLEIINYGTSNTLFNIVLFIGFSEIFFKIMVFFSRPHF